MPTRPPIKANRKNAPNDLKQPCFKPDKEYDALRRELDEGKKYVFERPLLLITLGIASARFAEKEQYIIGISPMLIGLLFFNLWFTANRIQSMSRNITLLQRCSGFRRRYQF